MITRSENSVAFNRKGYPLGIIDDGDPFDRPEGSLENLVNMDYDVETGELQTRNSTVLSDLLNGLTIPTGYGIMQGGLKVFSFNQPINQTIILAIVRHATDGDVKLYVNKWFNPPNEGATYYENGVFNYGQTGWISEWIELTKVYEVSGTITILNDAQFKINNAGLINDKGSYYSGWFALNMNIADVNKKFACVDTRDAYVVNGNESTVAIQNRPDALLTNLGWQTGHTIKLLRYPILYHKAPTSLKLKFNNVKIIKTNNSLKLLIGEEGNLWFGFINKYEKTNNVINEEKRYGWWLTYEQPPLLPILEEPNVYSTTGYLETDSKIGIRFKIEENSATGSKIKMFGLEGLMDGYQHICLAKFIKVTYTLNKSYLFKPRLYHHYERRISEARVYTGGENAVDDSYDPDGYVKTWTVLGYPNTYPLNVYMVGVEFFQNIEVKNPAGDDNRFSGQTLHSQIAYLPKEAIYRKSVMGVYTQGRLFVSDDSTDDVNYSNFRQEDVLAQQNKQSIDATDKDKNIAIDLLSSNPVVFKNNSIHIIGIEGQTEVNWRLLEAKGRMGCTYPKSIIRTPYGLMFANNDGIWLLSDAGEPLSMIKKRRLQAYLTLDKSAIMGEWNSKHSEAWFYIGNNTFWVCKLSKEEKQIGWKTYNFNFTGNDWDIIDLTTDEDNNFYIVTNKYLIKYKGDNETQTGQDANNTIIAFNWKENLNVLSTSNDKMHWIETLLRIKPIGMTRGNDVIINIYNEQDDIIKTKTLDISIADNIVIRNGTPNNQRALKVGLSGTLAGLERFKVQEILTRFILLKRPIKSSYMKAE